MRLAPLRPARSSTRRKASSSGHPVAEGQKEGPRLQKKVHAYQWVVVLPLGDTAVIEFRILGSLEVVDGDSLCEVGSPQQRELLTILLLRRGEPISTDLLIDALWGERAPPTAHKIVQGYVSNLRRALGEGLLVTRGRGYELRAAPEQVDVDQFLSLAGEGGRALEAGDAAKAAAVLRAALALWRGPPLADFSYKAFAQPEIARLEEARLAALSDRVDADLALGEHTRLVSELEALVREHPLRERLVCQLMLALYRSGRQADALESYRNARRRLVDQIGVEPGRELERLQQAILIQDPELEPPSRVSAPSRVFSAARTWNSGLVIAAGGLVLLGAAVAAAVSLVGGAASVPVAANSVAVINPEGNRVVDRIAVGAGPNGIAVGPGGIWVANTEDHSLSNIDSRSRTVVRTLSLGNTIDGVGADAQVLWTLDTNDRGTVRRIDPTFGSIIATRTLARGWGTLPASPTAIAVSGKSAWFADNDAAVVQVGSNGTILSTTDVGNHPSGIAVGAGSTWVADDAEDTVSRIDSSGGVSQTITVGRGPSGIVAGAGDVWVADTLDNSLVRIDPATNSVTNTIRVGQAPHGVAWGDGSVWVANSGNGTVSRVDPRLDRVISTIRVGQSPQSVAVSRGAVWVTVQARPAAPVSAAGAPPGVIRISRERPFPYLDPTRVGAYDQDEQQLLYETCAGLLTYPDRPGAAGKRLVPDVAKALPSVSANGRVYTFTIRPGFRFSPPSDAPVTAATFKHTIDRMLSPGDDGYERGFFGDIVGEAAFNAGKVKELKGVVAKGNKLQVRLTAPAPDLPARLAMLSFCAVPDDTPDEPQTQPIPSAGPYYIASSTPSQLILKRNPNYAGRRPRVSREIIYSFGESYANAVRDVEAGRIDYVSSVQLSLDTSSPASLFQSLQRRYGLGSAAARTGHQQYFVNPTVTLDYFALNGKRPLFASARVRRAVNYAIDRQELAAIGGPVFGGEPIGHYLPPGMPGSRPTEVYPLGRPNVTKARRLAAGIHARATMLTCNTTVCIQTAQLLKRELSAIGITVDITSLPIDAMSTRMVTSNSWDISWVTWTYDFADPSDYISGIFDPSLYGGGYGFGPPSARWIKEIRHAFTLTGKARLKNYGRLDDALAGEAAPLLAWDTQSAEDLFAPRVGCQVYQPIYGIDLGRLCVRRLT